jgi:hypothetical protein
MPGLGSMFTFTGLHRLKNMSLFISIPSILYQNTRHKSPPPFPLSSLGIFSSSLYSIISQDIFLVIFAQPGSSSLSHLLLAPSLPILYPSPPPPRFLSPFLIPSPLVISIPPVIAVPLSSFASSLSHLHVVLLPPYSC